MLRGCTIYITLTDTESDVDTLTGSIQVRSRRLENPVKQLPRLCLTFPPHLPHILLLFLSPSLDSPSILVMPRDENDDEIATSVATGASPIHRPHTPSDAEHALDAYVRSRSLVPHSWSENEQFGMGVRFFGAGAASAFEFSSCVRRVESPR